MNNLFKHSSFKILSAVSRSSSARGAVRGVMQSNIQQLSRISQSKITSKTTPRYFSSAADTLKEILQRELDEEISEGRLDLPAEIAELKATIEKDWKIVDDGAATRLIRSVGASKVVVSFHCQDTVDELEEEYNEEDNEDDEEPAAPFRFQILVTKAGSTLVVGCLSTFGVTTVESASVSTEDVETIQANGINRNLYQGPEFPELAEDLQDAFHEYIYTDLGINDDVSAFVSMYADYKEQSEYIGFLKSAQKVL